MKYKTKQAPMKTPHKQGWKVFLGVIALLIWTWMSTMAAQLVVGYLMVLILGEDKMSQSVYEAIFSALSYILTLVLVIFVPTKVTTKWKTIDKNKRIVDGLKAEADIDRNELGLRGLPTWTDVGLAPVGFVVSLILAAGLAGLFSLFSWFDATESQQLGFSLYATGVDRMIAFVTLVVIAPIVEEIIFRGWLYGKLRNMVTKSASNAISIVVSSLLVSVLFGLVHAQWNVGVNVFALSIVMCALREITGTIYAGILLHMLKNGAAFFLLFVLGIQ